MSIESPQLEDGFTPIANAIMDALARTRFSGYERSVLDFLFRKTYGWSKKSDFISLSQFVDGTGIAKPNIVHTLKRLIGRNIIHRSVVELNNAKPVRYEFNKHFGEWIALSKSTTHTLSLLNPTIQPLFKSTPTISISTTTSKRLEDKEGVSLGKAKKVKGVPTIEFDSNTQQVTGITDAVRSRFTLAFPGVDFDTTVEKLRVWIVKRGNPYQTYWKTLCTFAADKGEASMKHRSLDGIGRKNMEEW